MGKPEKYLKKWKDNPPVEVRSDDVKTVLDCYFKGEWSQDGTSHIVIRNELLKELQEYKPFGEICIPVKGGKTVKGMYVKKLVKAIETLMELNEVKND